EPVTQILDVSRSSGLASTFFSCGGALLAQFRPNSLRQMSNGPFLSRRSRCLLDVPARRGTLLLTGHLTTPQSRLMPGVPFLRFPQAPAILVKRQLPWPV